MNYDELEAGPEMDRLVAEAMGLTAKTVPDAWCYPNGVWAYHAGDYRPSDICDQAIEFATAKSACFVLFSPHTKEEGWLCSAQGYGHVGGTPGKAATPPLAICRSVLKMLAKDKP